MPPSRHRRQPTDRRGRRRTPPVAASGGFNSPALKITYGVIAVLFAGALLIGIVIYALPSGRTGSADGYVPGIGEELRVPSNRDHFSDNINITSVNPDGYTVPPTSGQHWNGWVQCGFYRNPVPDERIVHNMEHGNIIVHYNLTDPAQVEELADAFSDIGQTGLWGVARPYNPGEELFPEGSIGLTTWGVRDVWNVRDIATDGDNAGQPVGIDQERIERFFKTYSGKLGPEFPAGAPCTQGGVMNPSP